MNQDDIKKIRDERLRALVTHYPQSSLSSPDVIPEQVRSTENHQIPAKYNLRITPDLVNWLNDYAYTMSSRHSRKYTLTEAIDDAIRMLQTHTNIEIIKKPDIVRRKTSKHK